MKKNKKIIILLSVILLILYNIMNYINNNMKTDKSSNFATKNYKLSIQNSKTIIDKTNKSLIDFLSTTKTPIGNVIEHSFMYHDTKIQDNFTWITEKDWYKKIQSINNEAKSSDTNLDANAEKLAIDTNPDAQINDILSKNTVTDKLFTNPETLKYLHSEAAYASKYFETVNPLVETLFTEIKARIKEDDSSYPVQYDDKEFAYFAETKTGLNYSIYKRINLKTKKEETILDLNELAHGQKYIDLSFTSVSPEHDLLAYGVNYDGKETFTIRIKNLNTNQYLDAKIENTLHKIIWINNNEFLYTPVSDSWISKKVMHYNIEKNEHTEIYHEKMNDFSVNIGTFANKKYFLMSSSNGGSTRIRIFNKETIDINKDLESQVIFTVQEKDHIEYDVTINADDLYILTNDDNCKNNKILKVNLNTKEQIEYIKHSENRYLQNISATSNFLILEYKEDGLEKVDIIEAATKVTKTLDFPEKSYVVSLYDTNYFNNNIFIQYSSLKTPQLIWQYDFSANKLTKVKEKEIPVHYDSTEYEVEKILIGNAKVPVSLMYKKSLFKKDGTNPVFAFGYGAYGIEMSPGFNNNIFSLVDRGFIYAIIHTRGGGEISKDWHMEGKLLNKKNTFIDFIDSLKYLVDNSYTSRGKIAIYSASAGGLLVGNVLNDASDYLSCAIANAPFVDLINTMLDSEAPLTKNEYLEWGNPNNIEEFNYMLSYDPYLNAKGENYPPVFITAGLYDPRVLYHEPAKWVAKIRNQQLNMKNKLSIDKQYVIFDINMTQGHFNGSGRDNAIRDTAKRFSFVLLNTK